MKRDVSWWFLSIFAVVVVAGLWGIILGIIRFPWPPCPPCRTACFRALDNQNRRHIFESEYRVETAVVQKVHYYPSQRIIANRFDFLASRYAPPFYTVTLKTSDGERLETTVSASNQDITRIKEGQEIKIETYKTVARADNGRIFLRKKMFRSFK